MRTSPRQSSVCAVQFEAARDRHVRAAVGRSAAQRPPRGGDLWSESMCDSGVIMKLRLR
jgi:hypothetical protein